MGRERKYLNAAARQKAYRLRHGQKPKVPLAIRKGEKLGSQEGDLREKKKGETWEQYREYVVKSVVTARRRQEKKQTNLSEVWGAGARRTLVGAHEPEITEEYYELRYKYEKDLEELDNRVKGKMKKK